MSASIADVRAVVSSYAGAELWWADVFQQVGLGVDEVRMFMDTASRTPGTMLSQAVEKALVGELKAYAGPRGLLPGVESKSTKGDGRVSCVIRMPLTFEEKEALVAEVSGIGTVTFNPSAARCYTDHGVATAFNTVAWKWLRRMTNGRKTLEVGPKKAVVLLSAPEEGTYLGYTPYLGPRDAVRHTVDLLVDRMSKGQGAFSEVQVATAIRYLKNPEGFFKDCRIQDDDEQAEFIISNHADYDIDLDDVPGIMAKHGSRAWYGIITRPRGLYTGTPVLDGDVPALGVRYEVDREADEITFHFRGKSSFSYTHKFSSYVKREERNEYRWRGEHYDYVYTKLPMSTASTLMYAVYRVRKAGESFVEPTYVASGSRGMVEIKSVRVFHVAGRWRVSPITFTADRLALEKVMEHRRSFGVKGNVVDVMNFLSSVRVRFFLNGVFVGAEHPLSADLFAAAAVFVEAYVSMTRLGDEFDGKALEASYRASVVERGMVSQVAYWLQCLAGSIVKKPMNAVRRWREAVESMVGSLQDFEFSMLPCPDVVCVSSGESEGFVSDSLETAACCCWEIKEVRAAIASVGVYSDVEKRDLVEYCTRLETSRDQCSCGWDAVNESFTEVSDTGEVSGCTSETCVDESSEDEFFDARSVDRVAAIREYSGLMMHNKEALDSESVREAALLFRDGVPDTVDLLKSRTARVTPLAVKVRNGRLIKVRGDGQVSSVGAIVDVKRLVVVPTRQSRKNGRVDVVGVDDGWHYTSSALQVYNGEALSRAAQVASEDWGLIQHVNLMDLRFVRGPFGCGKTRAIVEMLVADREKGLSVAYLSATVSSVNDVMRALKKQGVDDILGATFDSYVMNKKWEVHRVYVDEGPMVHHGEMLVALGRMRAVEIAIFGDFNQIPFCSFTSEFDTPLASMENDVRIVKKMKVLHRCRLEVLVMWDYLYDGELVPCDCCPHVREEGKFSEVKRIVGVTDVPVSKTTRYMVFTQREKELLRDHVGDGASVEVLKKKEKGGLATVHETQGGTYDEVAVVRLTTFYDKAESSVSPAIYNRVPYVLVASTRARKKLVYYTASLESDALVKAVESVTEEKKQEMAGRIPGDVVSFDDLFSC